MAFSYMWGQPNSSLAPPGEMVRVRGYHIIESCNQVTGLLLKMEDHAPSWPYKIFGRLFGANVLIIFLTECRGEGCPVAPT